MNNDVRFMQRALNLAGKGRGLVHPNPMVGCVLVRRGKVVGEGYHHAFGKDHAELDALKRARAKARGATLYTNLEPCAHWGKTPPCVVAVVGAGVREVIVAMQDPNSQVSGKGFAFLRKHGVRVTQGLLQKEATELNRAFITWVREQRPYATLKAAVSIDGKIATSRGESRWITGPRARAQGHLLRAEADAVAVGIGTVLKDNPSLTAHGRGRNPRRIIFDSELKLQLNAHVTNRAATTWVFTTARASTTKRRALEKKGVAVYLVAKDKNGNVSLPEAARVLAREGIAHLLVEGGGNLLARFLEAGLADEVVWFIAPKIIGGETAKTAVEGRGATTLAKAWNLKDMQVQTYGSDLCLRAKVIR